MNKKGIIITLVVAVLSFITGFFVGDSAAINKVNKQIESNIQATSSQPETKQEESKKEEVKESAQTVQTIKVNEQSSVGNLGVKVLEAKETTNISNEAGKSAASGKFIVIKLELKNNGQEATEYNTHDFRLKTSQAIYEVDDNAFDALGNLNSQETIYKNNKNFIGVYDKFNSGIAKNTYIVFDIPKETKIEDLKLLIAQDKSKEFNIK